MSKLKTLAAIGTAADALAAQTAVLCDETPFAPGFNVIARVKFKSATGTPVVKIQGSADNSNWTDLAATSGILADDFPFEIVCMKYMRANCTTAGSAGDYAAYLEAA